MKVRFLRIDENWKLNSVGSIAFNYSADLENSGELHHEVIGAFCDDDETLMAVIHPNHYESNYCGTYLPCVGIGGVASLPQYRRSGAVRAIFNEIFRLAPERGWATSYLYPFSHRYYRMFGYECVMNRKSMKTPMSNISHIERNTSAVLFQGDAKVREDILTVYHEYMKNYNIAFKRFGDHFPNLTSKPHKDKRYTYVWYDENSAPGAYITFSINDDALKISDFAYTGNKAMLGMIGFLRMYEGQVDDVHFQDLPSDTELEYVPREYNDCEYSFYSFGMGRVLLVEKLLNTNKYEGSGHFSLKVNDYLEYNNYIFDVEFADGKVDVSKRSDGKYDIACAIPSLSRIMYGSDDYSNGRYNYLPDVEVCDVTGAETFVKAFPKRKLLLWDRF